MDMDPFTYLGWRLFGLMFESAFNNGPGGVLFVTASILFLGGVLVKNFYQSRIFWTSVLAAIVGLYFYLLMDERQRTFRYRLTVEIEADGRVHSGSSIFEVQYQPRSGNGQISGTNQAVRGVAPIVDLGNYGTIVAALSYGVEEDKYRQRRIELNVQAPGPGSPAEFPLVAYGLNVENIHMAQGRAVLKKYLPPFVWIPPGNAWQRAQPLFQQDFATTIDASVRLIQVTVEPAFDQPVLSQVAAPPSWLVEMRKAQPTGMCGRKQGVFTLCRGNDIEQASLKKNGT